MPCELNREAGCELTVMTEPELASLLLDEGRRVARDAEARREPERTDGELGRARAGEQTRAGWQTK